MEVLAARLATMAVLHLQVKDLHPDSPDSLDVQIPTGLLVDRKERELIPPCATCATPLRYHVPEEEQTIEGSDAGAWIYRQLNAVPATVGDPLASGMVEVSGCTCGVCDCCQAAVRVMLQEHFARLNVDGLEALTPEM